LVDTKLNNTNEMIKQPAKAIGILDEFRARIKISCSFACESNTQHLKSLKPVDWELTNVQNIID
jgi:hypothetical protein